MSKATGEGSSQLTWPNLSCEMGLSPREGLQLGSHSFPPPHQHFLPSPWVQLELRRQRYRVCPSSPEFIYCRWASPASPTQSRFSLPVAKVSSGGEKSLKQESQRKILRSVQSAAWVAFLLAWFKRVEVISGGSSDRWGMVPTYWQALSHTTPPHGLESCVQTRYWIYPPFPFSF